MAETAKRVAVLGAGVMGTSIAAHFASAGVETLLMDMVPKDATDAKGRNRLAREALERAQKARPAAFFEPQAANLVTAGNFDDDLAKLASCDLIIEAVTERLDIKQSLFARVAEHIRSDAILASNTSGLSVKEMAETLPKGLAERFCVMHFFNPVRYMHLVEVVAGPHTNKRTMERVAGISESLGKGVVIGKDTVNFVANRIGVFSMMHAIHAMREHELTVEEVDKIAGKPMARPSSAAFRTADLVGLDTLAHVAKNCRDHLPNDRDRNVFELPGWVEGMLKAGQLGQKSGAGFYKKVGAEIQVMDVAQMAYRPQAKVRFESLGAVAKVEDPRERLKALVWAQDKAAKFAWANVARTLCYAAERMGEIADDVASIDNAMRWGFNWELGPFEAWDAIGVDRSIKRMQAEGMAVPAWVLQMQKNGCPAFYEHASSQGDKAPGQRYYDGGKGSYVGRPHDAKELSFALLKSDAKRLLQHNAGASLVDLGDGCVALEVHTKMNTITLQVMDAVERAVDVAEQHHQALVLANDGEHFGAGFNLMLLVEAMKKGAWGEIETMIARFQQVGQRLRYARIPCVSAPHQYTFGGALELAMACDATQAYVESYMGLVEAGVGLVPGGGGCLRLLERVTNDARQLDNVDLLPFVGAASLQIATAKVSTGAEDARRMFYLRPSDGVSLSRSHLTADAKGRALGLAMAGYRPPLPAQLKAAGTDARATLQQRIWSMVEGRYISQHDAHVGVKVAHILCGGDRAPMAALSENDVLDLEREAFLSLCGHEKTQARIESMMLHNKPLRN